MAFFATTAIAGSMLTHDAYGHAISSAGDASLAADTVTIESGFRVVGTISKLEPLAFDRPSNCVAVSIVIATRGLDPQRLKVVGLPALVNRLFVGMTIALGGRLRKDGTSLTLYADRLQKL
jgi:hypothetical protein